MGLFFDTVAHAQIDFYSDYEVAVDCRFMDRFDNDEKDKLLVYLVAFYYAKTLYNLSDAPGADLLMEYVQNIYDTWKTDFKNHPTQEYGRHEYAAQHPVHFKPGPEQR
jgi:hypothetical protein